ncbi:hypothetical protein MVEN_01606800 [Mycena venus]|uniref:Uncharacterized protein n=1 Tax=Mycena venus TaxID=2733690 RepID=A0A8H7CRU4_9AGAR|nr:hypothetical protein MVEN_01606800 [Mycena venus]
MTGKGSSPLRRLCAFHQSSPPPWQPHELIPLYPPDDDAKAYQARAELRTSEIMGSQSAAFLCAGKNKFLLNKPNYSLNGSELLRFPSELLLLQSVQTGLPDARIGDAVSDADANTSQALDEGTLILRIALLLQPPQLPWRRQRRPLVPAPPRLPRSMSLWSPPHHTARNSRLGKPLAMAHLSLGSFFSDDWISYDEEAAMECAYALSLGPQTDGENGASSFPRRMHTGAGSSATCPHIYFAPIHRRFVSVPTQQDVLSPPARMTPRPAPTATTGTTSPSTAGLPLHPPPAILSMISAPFTGRHPPSSTATIRPTNSANGITFPFHAPPHHLRGGGDRVHNVNNGPDSNPIVWLVPALSGEQAQVLLDMCALVSDTTATFFHACRPIISGFVGTFPGFTICPGDGHIAHYSTHA